MVSGTNLKSIWSEQARDMIRRYTRVTARDNVGGPQLDHRRKSAPAFVSSSHTTAAAVRPAAKISIDVVV